MNKIALNILDNSNSESTLKKQATEIDDDVLSNTSIEGDTVPDEEFNLEYKRRNKVNSVSNVLQHRGPNINLKINHKRYSNQKEKELFLEKIKRKKKTELCKNYELYKDCYYGDNCSFAHGLDELRDNIILPTYKTKLCKSFVENKTCNFGTRCSYQHKIM